MHSGVARCAHRDQVIFRMVAGVAAELSVVHVKVRHRAARLTPPAVATQDLLAQPLIRQRVQSQGPSTDSFPSVGNSRLAPRPR